MTTDDLAEVQKMIQAAILEERERVAKAAGMVSMGLCEVEVSGSLPGPIRIDLDFARVMADFARRLRGKEGE